MNSFNTPKILILSASLLMPCAIGCAQTAATPPASFASLTEKAPVSSALARTISNPLGLDFPNELVHFDWPADAVKGEVSIEIKGEKRPAQVETLTVNGQKIARVWFVASLDGGKNGDKTLDVQLVPGATSSPLAVKTQGETLTVDNGVAAFRLPNFGGKFAAPRELESVAAPWQGIKVKGDASDFYGKTRFAGEGKVVGATTEVLAQGPVYAEIRLTYEFAGTPQPDPEKLQPQRAGYFYQATLRFVAGDAWAQVYEEFRLPYEPSYSLELKDGLKPDTVMFVPWFSYEAFGGNTEMQFSKLEPRAKQRGPFVSLRPRWNQAPGGGQDFFVTRGGPSPSRPKGAKEEVVPPAYQPDAPAVGIVAIEPMKWLNPYAQTIAAYAENGDSARLRFPLNTGSRAYALVAGARREFDNTGKLNSLVRRRSDWTLDDQIHKYTLDWKRDPSKAGPNILITREHLQRLQADWKNNANTPEMRVLREYAAKKDQLKRDDLALFNLITGEKANAPRVPDAGLWLSRRYQDDFLNPTGQTRKLDFAMADLFADGKPLGGAAQAAVGYIFSDLNQWPGYENGWGPGNPNFHTDKYKVAIMAGAAMLDHPDAATWLAYGERNFEEDLKKVLLAPDGVGYECPGYSGYSLGLQLEIAEIFKNTGYGNPVVENPHLASPTVDAFRCAFGLAPRSADWRYPSLGFGRGRKPGRAGEVLQNRRSQVRGRDDGHLQNAARPGLSRRFADRSDRRGLVNTSHAARRNGLEQRGLLRLRLDYAQRLWHAARIVRFVQGWASAGTLSQR